MEKFYIYSKNKNKVIEIKNVVVEENNGKHGIYRIITSDDEILYELREYPLKIYKNKDEVEEE